jgi:hypothetical protein
MIYRSGGLSPSPWLHNAFPIVPTQLDMAKFLNIIKPACFKFNAGFKNRDKINV